MLDKGFVARSHSGVIHMVGKEFISTGFLDKRDGKLLSRLFELRQSGDYDDLYNATEDEVFPYIERTETFLNEMAGLITLV